MASNTYTPVAEIRFRYSGIPDVEEHQKIYANEEFDIGRLDFEETRDISVPKISTHHVKFRCIAYEEDGPVRVAPMIYARVLSKNNIQLERAGKLAGSCSVSRLDPDVLLNHRDVLQLTSTISLQFILYEDHDAKTDGLTETQRNETSCFSDRYVVFPRRLGVGGQASVFVAVKQKTQRQLACKIVPVPFVNLDALEAKWKANAYDQEHQALGLAKAKEYVAKQRKDIPREFSVLAGLSHPNIVALEKVIHTPNNYYIFEELITGGDLCSYLDKNGVFGEPQAVVVVRQLLKAVEYLHERGIVHRDIKPENVLMTSWREGARVVLTDFGQARTLEDVKTAAREAGVFRMQSVVGTIGYVAPEVLNQRVRDEVRAQGYSKSIDIWAIGCIAAVLLTGEMLFPEQYQHEDDLETQPPDIYDLGIMDRGGRWALVGRKAKSFIRGCCVADENQRLTAKQALLHAWFTNKHYAQELEAAYQRAIQDWSPRGEDDVTVEFMDTASFVSSGRPEKRETKSRHFMAPPLRQPKSALFRDVYDQRPAEATARQTVAGLPPPPPWTQV